MGEPQIRYVKTTDGVNIAYWSIGDGPAFVSMPNFASNIGGSWDVPEIRRFYELFSQRRTFIRYERRGCGLSDRDVSDRSVDAQQLDLEAVVDALGLDTFDLHAYVFSGPDAIAYVTRHPGRVRRLILWGTAARGSDLLEISPRSAALQELAKHDYDMYLEATAIRDYGFERAEFAKRMAEMEKDSLDRRSAWEYGKAVFETDVTDRLPRIDCPTLVVHPEDDSHPSLAVTKSLAAAIPAARLVTVKGKAATLFFDLDQSVRVIDNFFSETGGDPISTARQGVEPSVRPRDEQRAPKRRRRTIQVADQDLPEEPRCRL